MPAKRNKYRLQVVLQHRGSRPGFHWAIVISPKNELDNSNTMDSYRFHVTNSAQANAVLGTNGNFEWRFEHEPFNLLAPGNVVARVLLAKMPPLGQPSLNLDSGSKVTESSSWKLQIDSLLEILQTVPLVQNDVNWNCRTWTRAALLAFHSFDANGPNPVFNTIPVVDDDQLLEQLGTTALQDIKTRKEPIRRVGDIPIFDIRQR
ncbi:hypothetical protein GALMADRAFT_884898 [Galerina marginata CBS 339.88]|uniref:Uncharacterized protein n=1 Tax=Galerina marginata (strain CBS 339.88) TaxID=685588 RepID=A0A067SHL1_GALM3|nr:hypothetical protein GALMADRAFT_884898 [Galerina marginata CBS 339.88]